jgi:hypothetical protein
MEPVSAGSRRPVRDRYRDQSDRDLLEKNDAELDKAEMSRGFSTNLLISGGGCSDYLDRPLVLNRTPCVSLIARFHEIVDCTVNAPH